MICYVKKVNSPHLLFVDDFAINTCYFRCLINSAPSRSYLHISLIFITSFLLQRELEKKCR